MMSSTSTSRALVLCGRTASLTPRKTQEHGCRNRNRTYSLSLGSSFPGCQTRVHIFHGGTNRRFAVMCNSSAPGAPPTSPPPSDSGRKWMLGMILSVVVPFVTTRGGPLRKIENELKSKVEMVENLVEGVEEVAEDVEKLAGKIAEDLPGGQLKKTLEKIEDVAEQIEEEAELIEDLVDKVEEVEEQLDSAIESTVHAKDSKKRKRKMLTHSTSKSNRKENDYDDEY